jgi:hypothetical protein
LPSRFTIPVSTDKDLGPKFCGEGDGIRQCISSSSRNEAIYVIVQLW